ncbi:mevalonate kinase [Aerococcaceae bacterium NML201209]|nr:mevalonate kinase [Aerococcaceae bacterium NML201209]
MPKHTISTKKTIGHGIAHGKIILMGEHSVVYDYPAIALPFYAVQANVKVQAKHNLTEHHLTCQYYDGPVSRMPEALANLKHAVYLTFECLEQVNQPLHIQIDSTIPQERGMGSSAAVSVALIRGICDFYGIVLPIEQLRYIANQAEVIAHATTSGIDTLMTSSAQPIIYHKGQNPLPFELNLNAYLVVADSGQTGQTKLAVQKVADLLAEKPIFARESLEAMGSFVQRAYRAIQHQDVSELGRLMSYNHYYLNRIGVSTPEIDQIVNAAWLSGALGAKLTGGGLGGCVIALAQTADDAQRIANAMQKVGAIHTWTMPI